MKLLLILTCAFVAAVSGAAVELSGRIIGGSPATANQFPWHVSITSRNGTSGSSSVCGGSLLSPNWVLTSAYCTRPYNTFEIGLGSNLLNSPAVRASAYRVIEHPVFNPTNAQNNLALIQLSSSVALTAAVQPIRLPRRAQSTDAFIGAAARISGFGVSVQGGALSNQLNWVGISVISNVDCTNTFGSSVIVASTLCGRGTTTTSQSPCTGDIGGALVISEAGIWTQIGATSFISNAGCGVGHPSGYTRMTSYLDWVQAITGIAVRP